MTCAIVWFRQDLRLADNPALSVALDACEQVIPLYVHSPNEAGMWRPGAASDWWLHYSLGALDESLRAIGSRLVIRRGSSLDAIRHLVRESGATHVFWNRLYEPLHIERDKHIKLALRDDGLSIESYNGSLLFEPWQGTKADGRPYRVFTPFWRACIKTGLPASLHSAPAALPAVPSEIATLEPADLGLLPTIAWDAGLRSAWRAGEGAAVESLTAFIKESIATYDNDRDRPDLSRTSRLSPHLHFGEISPRQVVERIYASNDTPVFGGRGKGEQVFLAEIGWREFAYHSLYHFPDTTDSPLDKRFEDFPWAVGYESQLLAWQRGMTGIPMVDAGMRELWRTGWMHNRVRMIVASFLTKNLLVPWQEGARWFWDTLVDADLASNTAGWQWTAGSGTDAAPYFRVFNPVLQGQRYDPDGAYVRRWIPEIAKLPGKYLHQPWTAPAKTLSAAGIVPGETYPKPIADLKASRERALACYARIREPRRGLRE